MRPVAESYKFIAKLSEDQFILPYWENKVDYGIVLSYRPVRLHRLAGGYDNLMTWSTLSPSKRL